MNVQAFDDTTFKFHDLDVSAAYLAATGMTSMRLDVDIPGFDPAWRIDFALEHFRQFAAVKFAVNATLTSEIFDVAGLPPRAAKRRPLSKREVSELRRSHSSLKLASRNLSISAK
jgi:hypothetical protein